jgi:hypothetical protein
MADFPGLLFGKTQLSSERYRHQATANYQQQFLHGIILLAGVRVPGE